MTVQELEIIEELFKRCTSQNISDGLMCRLNEKWGCPDFKIDYKKHEHILYPIDQVKEFYSDNNLKFNLDKRAYDFVVNLSRITKIFLWDENIHIQAKADNYGFDTLAINKNGEVFLIGRGL